jgi:UDP-GlcNAc:undecaprenyl-phosphate GlcNAc-1-phosphate transferase
MNLFTFFIFFLIFFIIEFIYLKIADKYNIIDHPNHRSSHAKITIRGGGIIFSIALLLGSLYFGLQYTYFLLGLLLISLISFIDDIKTTSNRIRFIFHLIASALLFYQLGVYSFSFYWIVLAFIFAVAVINAINFMDGVNGITGGFGLITLLTLYYINQRVIAFTIDKYLILSIISLLVFNFFNFRVKAKCFAGDIGSVSLAFIILFFLLQLMIKTNNLSYSLLLLVYGLDTATTILFRILRKENVFEAHRNHFYQFLVNEKKFPHLIVAFIYMLVQGIINLILINFLHKSIVTLFLILTFSMIIFALLRLIIEGPQKLTNIKK